MSERKEALDSEEVLRHKRRMMTITLVTLAGMNLVVWLFFGIAH